MLKNIILKSANLFGYTIKKTFSDPVVDNDLEFISVYNKCKDYTITPIERMYALYNAVKFIVGSKIPGDFVECGVFKGGSIMLVAYTLRELRETNRKIYLYDTFAGMSEPTEDDFQMSNNKSAISTWKSKQKKDNNNWAFSPLSEVQKNMYSTGYPENNIIFVMGKVEETIPNTLPSNIALLRLDTDWYESTKHELTHLFPLVSKNGILLIDDYGCFAGAKKATDEYFLDKLPMLLNRIDFTGRIGIKME